MGWERAEAQAKARRYKRLATAARILPEVEDFCALNGIKICRTRDDTLHFEFQEYIVVWPMATNRVTIQYRLPQHNERIRFMPTDVCRPKILVALEEVKKLYEKVDRSRALQAVAEPLYDSQQVPLLQSRTIGGDSLPVGKKRECSGEDLHGLLSSGPGGGIEGEGGVSRS